jgi:hypothetical protein
LPPRAKILFAVALLAVLAVAGGAFLWWWVGRPPEAVRLLPDPDAVVYLNLRPVRLASAFAKLPQVQHDPEYDEFVRASGFDFERDLDEAGIAVHMPPEAATVQSGTVKSATAPETRYSEAFVGRFDHGALARYFEKIARGKEAYAGATIFTVPVEGRTVRLAVLSKNLAVVSNVEDASVIRGMIDRSQAHGLMANGPELVTDFYKEVPAGSLAWTIAKSKHDLPLPNGLELAMPDGVTWVGSLRFAGGLELKAQAIAANEADAKKVAESLNTLLALFHSIQSNVKTQGADADVKRVFDSVQVVQENNRAVVTARVPAGFLEKMAGR